MKWTRSVLVRTLGWGMGLAHIRLVCTQLMNGLGRARKHPYNDLRLLTSYNS